VVKAPLHYTINVRLQKSTASCCLGNNPVLGSERTWLFLCSLSQMLWFKTGWEDERLMVFNGLLSSCLIATWVFLLSEMR